MTFLESLGETDKLDLKQSTLKTAMLLALANADRASDLHLVETQFKPNGVQFVVAALSKTRRSGPPREVFYPQFNSSPYLCPVRSLEPYLRATEKYVEPKKIDYSFLSRSHIFLSV